MPERCAAADLAQELRDGASPPEPEELISTLRESNCGGIVFGVHPGCQPLYLFHHGTGTESTPLAEAVLSPGLIIFTEFLPSSYSSALLDADLDQVAELMLFRDAAAADLALDFRLTLEALRQAAAAMSISGIRLEGISTLGEAFPAKSQMQANHIHSTLPVPDAPFIVFGHAAGTYFQEAESIQWRWPSWIDAFGADGLAVIDVIPTGERNYIAVEHPSSNPLALSFDPSISNILQSRIERSYNISSPSIAFGEPGYAHFELLSPPQSCPSPAPRLLPAIEPPNVAGLLLDPAPGSYVRKSDGALTSLPELAAAMRSAGNPVIVVSLDLENAPAGLNYIRTLMKENIGGFADAFDRIYVDWTSPAQQTQVDSALAENDFTTLQNILYANGLPQAALGEQVQLLADASARGLNPRGYLPSDGASQGWALYAPRPTLDPDPRTAAQIYQDNSRNLPERIITGPYEHAANIQSDMSSSGASSALVIASAPLARSGMDFNGIGSFALAPGSIMQAPVIVLVTIPPRSTLEGSLSGSDLDPEGYAATLDTSFVISPGEPVPGNPQSAAFEVVIPGDTDGDGVWDRDDNCPKTANPGQENADGDRWGDACDGCPNDGSKVSPGQCGCGNPDTDSDGDSTADCNDGCPQDPGKTAPGICGCGTSDVDSDQDGTPNCEDECPNDPNKTVPGECGCHVSDVDHDGDGTLTCNDGCPFDPNKLAPGVCGCDSPDIDSDGDGALDCNDYCWLDPNKTAAGQCGCGIPDTDSDGDGTANCDDECSNDPNKVEEGWCGCGNPETDSDGDSLPDCVDGCDNDPEKFNPGQCGCGSPDTDSDSDGTANCIDECDNDPLKTAPGLCGCGAADDDSDNDGTPNCNDDCPNDSNKTAPGICGCGSDDADSDGDGTFDCNDTCPQDPNKTAPLVCGCGEVETPDTDGDGTLDCVDECPVDPNKTAPGNCGCGTAETPDSDGDGVFDCHDLCPQDPNKTAPGMCGCGTPDTDSDNDGTPDCQDQCPSDPNKIEPGECGCGTPDTDSDNDGTPDCQDQCPSDPNKIEPGECGCGTADTDTDGDGTADCNDECSLDPAKIMPGQCGCGTPDTDSDSDGTADCNDECSDDPEKTAPGACGCGTPDTDSDNDGSADCEDQCPSDPNKLEPGECGCGVSDRDSDGDGTPDCEDLCPNDGGKIAPGECGCGTPDTDSDGDGVANCAESCDNNPDLLEPDVCGCLTPTDTNNNGMPDCLESEEPCEDCSFPGSLNTISDTIKRLRNGGTSRTPAGSYTDPNEEAYLALLQTMRTVTKADQVLSKTRPDEHHPMLMRDLGAAAASLKSLIEKGETAISDRLSYVFTELDTVLYSPTREELAEGLTEVRSRSNSALGIANVTNVYQVREALNSRCSAPVSVEKASYCPALESGTLSYYAIRQLDGWRRQLSKMIAELEYDGPDKTWVENQGADYISDAYWAMYSEFRNANLFMDPTEPFSEHFSRLHFSAMEQAGWRYRQIANGWSDVVLIGWEARELPDLFYPWSPGYSTNWRPSNTAELIGHLSTGFYSHYHSMGNCDAPPPECEEVEQCPGSGETSGGSCSLPPLPEPDDDGDGTPNDDDQCPLDPNKTEPGPCGCGTLEQDIDEDGLYDCLPEDQCYGEEPASPGDPCPSGHTWLDDIDQDLVLNPDDNCMTVYNPGQEDENGDGIGDACQSGPIPEPTPVPSPTPSPTETPVPSPTPEPNQCNLENVNKKGEPICPNDANGNEQACCQTSQLPKFGCIALGTGDAGMEHNTSPNCLSTEEYECKDCYGQTVTLENGAGCTRCNKGVEIWPATYGNARQRIQECLDCCEHFFPFDNGRKKQKPERNHCVAKCTLLHYQRCDGEYDEQDGCEPISTGNPYPSDLPPSNDDDGGDGGDGGDGAGDELAQAGENFLSNYCYECHQAPNADGGLSTIDKKDTLLNNVSDNYGEPYLKPNDDGTIDAAASLIWQMIEDGLMPQGDNNPTDAEKQKFKEFIEAGYNLPEPKEQEKRYSQFDIWLIATHHIHTLPKHVRPYIRYIDFSPQYNKGDKKMLEKAKIAASKTANSLNWYPDIFPFKTLDKEKTLQKFPQVGKDRYSDIDDVLYYINIRDYTWALNYIRELEFLYDMAGLSLHRILRYRDPDSHERKAYDSLAAATGTVIPIYRGDWFVWRANEPDAYLLFNGFIRGGSLRDIEKHFFGIDTEEDFIENRLCRAGVQTSGVAKDGTNRIMDRHAVKYYEGAYWISYDFLSQGGGEAVGSANVIKNPLGPKLKWHPQGGLFENVAFVQDGSEIIFNYPNGSQGYVLANGNKLLVDFGPNNLVEDNLTGPKSAGMKLDDHTIYNAVSCHACHSEGMKKREEDVRDNAIDHLTGVYGGTHFFTKKAQAIFFPTNASFQNILKNDEERYFNALKRSADSLVQSSSVPGKPWQVRSGNGGDESIGWTFPLLDAKNVSLEELAAELGFQSDENETAAVKLRTLIEQWPRLDNVFGALREGGGVPHSKIRPMWTLLHHYMEFVPYSGPKPILPPPGQ